MHYHRWQRHGNPMIVKSVFNENRCDEPLYSTYYGMLERCGNSNHQSFEMYGGRGIKVCDEWIGIRGFNKFAEDMGIKPDGYTLDRIDPNGGYSKSNCRWASNSLQSINKRKRSDNKSGVTGVYFDNTYKKWKSEINVRKKTIRLGYFTELAAAIKTRKEAEQKYFTEIRQEYV